LNQLRKNRRFQEGGGVFFSISRIDETNRQLLTQRKYKKTIGGFVFAHKSELVGVGSGQ